MRSVAVLAVVVAAGPALASCGGARRVVTDEHASSCGPAYVAQVAGRQLASASCAGVIPAGDPLRFTVRVGERFRIQVAGERSGALDFPVPTPTGPGVRRLGRRGDLATYVAIAPGTTRLVARHARLCMEARSEPRYADCPAAVIRVRAR